MTEPRILDCVAHFIVKFNDDAKPLVCKSGRDLDSAVNSFGNLIQSVEMIIYVIRETIPVEVAIRDQIT